MAAVGPIADRALEALSGGPLGPLMLLGLALGVLLYLDRRRARDPRRLAAQRLDAVLAHSWRDMQGAVPGVDMQVFQQRRAGLLGAAVDWLDRVSASLGGRGGLRNLIILAALIGLALAAGLVMMLQTPLAVALVAGVASGVGAFVVIGGGRRRAWALAFQDQLIEAVELLARTIRAGYAAPAAVRHVGTELPAPVGPIFVQIADQEDLGVEPRKALRDAAKAVQLGDFTFLAVALVIQRETGGQLGDSLDNLHYVLRRRREARLKTQALTAQGRMSAKVVAAIPVVAFAGVYLLNPEQTSLMLQPGTGLMMLGAAIGLVVLGMLVVQWMVRSQP